VKQRNAGEILVRWLKSQWTQALSQLSEINWIFATALFLIGLAIVILAPKQAQGYAIASATALFIAFVAYPWQKARDRVNELRKEQREAYRRFFRTTLDARQAIFDFKLSSENEAKAAVAAIIAAKNSYENAVSELCVSASGPAVAAAQKMHSLIYSIFEEWENALRNLLHKGSGAHPVVDVSSAFEAVIQKHRAALFDAENEIRDAMKSDEFGFRNSAVIEGRSQREKEAI